MEIFEKLFTVDRFTKNITLNDFALMFMHPVKSIYKSTLEVLLDTVKQKDRHGRSESQMLDLQLEYQLLNPSQIQLRADSFNDPIKFAQDLTHAISRFDLKSS